LSRTQYTLTEVADEIGVSYEDVLVVAQIELTSDEEFDQDETVSAEGRKRLIQHFRGGKDPD
jgi:hypothetical protein